MSTQFPSGRSLSLPADARLAGRSQRLLLAVFSFFFVLWFTQADRWLEKAGLLPSRPILLFLIVMVPLAGATLYLDWTGPDRGGRTLLLIESSLLILVPFGVLCAQALLWALHPTANWSAGGTYILLLPMDFTVLTLFLVVGSWEPVRKRIPLLAMLSGGVLVLTILVDVFMPGSFSNQASRAAGLAENANTSAFLTISAGCLALTFGGSRRRDLTILAIVSIAVLLTFSRGGLLLLLALLVLYAGQVIGWRTPSPARSSRHLRRLLPVTVAIAVLALGLFAARLLVNQQVGVFSRSVAQKRVGMLTGGATFLTDDDSRLGLLKSYGQLAAEAPFVGHGTGYSYGLVYGPHNRFLQAWTNLGFGGVVTYCALLLGALTLFLVRRSRTGVVYSMLLIGWSFFSHDVLEQRSVPMTLGLLAASVALTREADEAGPASAEKP